MADKDPPSLTPLEDYTSRRRFASLRGGTTKQSSREALYLDCFVPRNDGQSSSRFDTRNMNAIDEIPLRGMEGPYYSDQRRLLTLTTSKRFKPPRGTSYYNLHSRQAGTSLPNTAVPWSHSGLDPESHSPPEDYSSYKKTKATPKGG